MVNMKEFFWRELIVSFFLGSVPMLLIFVNGGEGPMLNRFGMLNPGDIVLNYLFILLAVHLIVYGINKLTMKRSDNIEATVNYIHGITEQIGFSLHTVYRAIVGAVPVLLVLLVRAKGVLGAGPLILLSLITFIGAIFMCCILSAVNENTKRRKQFIS